MKTARVIILLAAVIVASGCTSNQGQKGIEVESISVTPDTIKAGNDATVSVKVKNNGLIDGEIYPGEKNGDDILTNYCPDYFKIASFRSSSPTRDESGKKSYKLGEDDVLELKWRLDQYNKDKIPRLKDSTSCDLKFQIPFNYSTTAYRQIMVLQNDETDTGDTKIGKGISKGPLRFSTNLIGSLPEQKNKIVKGENASIEITRYSAGSSTTKDKTNYIGLVEVGELGIETGKDDLLEVNDNCLDEATLKADENPVYRCDIDIKEDKFTSPFSTGEITLKANYTYKRDLGEKTITVKPRGK